MENHSLAVMDPIDISSSESDVDDWDLEGDMEPETSSRSKSGSLSNDHSSHVPTHGPYYKGYDGVQVPRFLLNGYKRPQIQIKPSSSRGFRSFATSSSQPDTKWGLPPHLQACLEEHTPSSRSADTLENLRSRVKRKTHSDAFYPRAVKLESGTDYNTLDEESDEEVIMYEKVGSRRIPLESGYKKVKSEVSPPPFRPVSTAQYGNSGSVKVEGTTLRPSFGSVSTAQYATSGSVKAESTGLPPSFGSTAQPVNFGQHGVAAEKKGERNERLVYQAALQDLNQPRVEASVPDGLLSVSLLKHQRIALAWLLPKERASLNCCGGFLADDQGLGKTISMIALIQMQRHLESKPKVDDEQKKTTESLNLDDDDDFDAVKVTTCQKSKKGSQDIRTTRPAAGTLVVCPASVLRQWASELKNKVAEESELSVLIYHGSNRTKDPIELASYDVVLTTYALVGNEVPKLPLADEADGDKEWHELSPAFNPKKKKKGKKEKSQSEIESESGPLAKVGWLRVILDEAQIIKNHRTKVARACCGLRAKRRWCLSGTPIQNTIEDLFSYFRFLRYDPYAEYRAFCSAIKNPILKDKNHGYKKLQAVLRAIMLRRTKGTIIDGEPILNLPPKTINMAKFDFSTTERTFYDDLEQKSRSQFKKYADAGTVNQNYANILLLLLRLRQACGHPRLTLMGSDSKSKGSIETAMKFPQDVLLTFLNCLDTSAPICHLCSEPPEDAVISSRCRHIFCHPCISDYLTGDDNTCPAPECHKRLGIDFMFSKSTILRCIKSDDHSSMPSDDGGWDDYISTKIKAAIEHLESTCKPQKNTLTCSDSVETEEAPIKAIVFSQWTKMLDIFELSLRNSGLEYRRLDGTMTLGLRDANVYDFNTDPKVSIILMSLKAGNLGLNMIAATHVVLLDLWWNPTTEDQAIDRAHRIGQTRPVTVTRMTIKNTVEDRILALQEKKREMVASAFGEEYGGGQATRLTVDDLKYLFMY